MRVTYILFLLFTTFSFLSAQKSNDIKQAIIAESIFNSEDEFTISWISKDDADSYRIQYRTDMNGPWSTAASGVTDTFYTFLNQTEFPVEVSIAGENGSVATGYIITANEYFEADKKERMLILAFDSIHAALTAEIEAYQEALYAEMIESEVIVIKEDETVEDVKAHIIDKHAENALDYMLILGHVPVPYSGNNAIDGHTPDHKGAWVADGYYADIDGSWTDVIVDNSEANREENKNVPGDGKFDQSYFPSDIDIALGRVDFSNLPKLNQSEIELTRRYLERNIAYRSGLNKATRRAVIDNNFNLVEGFAQGAIKSFHTFLEPDSINYGNYAQCKTKDYLFTFGAGGGNYQGASGIINTNQLVTDSIQSVFTTIFGSYFGDWDISNNLLRASLARGSALINAWSGRPVWHFHQMALGQPVSTILLNVQNSNGNYYSQFGKKGCHTTLLGDPSVKLYYHKPVENVNIDAYQITWEYLDSDPEVQAFTVYYEKDDEWILVGDGPQEEQFIYLGEIQSSGNTNIMIRPVGLISSRSGSYYNEGPGVVVNAFIVNSVEEEYGFEISPNPAHDIINIKSSSEINLVQIFDLNGRMIQEVKKQKNINISGLLPGTYTISIDGITKQFIKH